MRHARMVNSVRVPPFRQGVRAARVTGLCRLNKETSPNQVLTHAARAAAKRLNFLAPPVADGRARRTRRALVRVTKKPDQLKKPFVAARGAREGFWLE